MKAILSIALVATLFTTSAFAETKTIKKTKRTISSLIEEIPDSEKKITKDLNLIVNGVKAYKLTDGSPDYAKIETSVSAAIGKIIQIAEANKNSDVAQLYKSAAEHIPLFKGFVYRLRKVAEVSDMAYLSAIWALKKFKQTSKFRAPYMEALFDLATMPNPEETIPANATGQKGMFKSVSELQDWMVKVVAPKFNETISTMKKIAYKSGSGLHAIGLIDAELLVGELIASRYDSSKHAHKEWVLTSGQLIGLVSALENYMGMLYYSSSYNLEKLAEVSNILTQETFKELKGSGSRLKIFNSIAKRVDLLSTKRVFELTTDNSGSKKSKVGLFGINSKNKKDSNYKNFMTIRPIAKSNVKGTNHSNYLRAAQHFFKMAATDQLEYHKAMLSTYGMSGEDKLLVNPASYKATLDATPYIDQEEVLKKSIEILNTDGKSTINDHYLTKTYTVDISVLFDIEKVNDLRKFLPNQFLDSRNEKNPETPSGLNWSFIPGSSNRIVKWKENFTWNYNYNKAQKWKSPTFGGLLPNIKEEMMDGDDMALHLTNVGSLPEIPYVALWLGMFYGY